MTTEIDDKTEQPTERRRRLAREQGHGPRSSDLTLSCRLLGVAVALQFFGTRLVHDCARLLSDSLQRLPIDELTISIVTSRGWEALLQIGISAAGFCACVLVAGLVAQWFQVGFRFQTAELMPDLSRLGPRRAWSKLWSLETTAQAVMALLKYVIILGVGGWYIWSSLGQSSSLVEYDVSTIAETIGRNVVTLAWLLAAIYLIIGLADYGIQVWKFEQSLKMSPAEIREEARQQSGDPQWQQRRREIWRQSSSTDATKDIGADYVGTHLNVG